MDTAPLQVRAPRGLFPDKSVPRLYYRIVEVASIRHDNSCTADVHIPKTDRFIRFHQHWHPRNLVTDDLKGVLDPSDSAGTRGGLHPETDSARDPVRHKHVLEQPRHLIGGHVDADWRTGLTQMGHEPHVSVCICHVCAGRRL